MWKSININDSNIEAATERSVLIKMPSNSNYAGYKFWHPAKLVRSGRNSSAKTFSYTDDFKFNIFKNGSGKTNRFEKVAEDVLSALDIEVAFETIDRCVGKPQDKESFLKVEEPEFRNPVKANVDSELQL